MNSIKATLIFLILALFQNSCQQPRYYYQAQSVDISVTNRNGRISVTGPSVFSLPDSFVWCGSPIKIQDRYYLFYSAWESGPNLPSFANSWMIYSKIGIAVSEFPDKNFHSIKLFLKGRKDQGDSTAWDSQEVTNAHIKEFKGKYYLYYAADRDPGNPPGLDLSKQVRSRLNQKIGVIEFNSIEDLLAGRFLRSDRPLLAPRTRVINISIADPSPDGTTAKPDNLIVVNPAVVFRPSDKKYLLYFKGNIYDPNWRGVLGVATSDSPAGPFIATDNFVFDFTDKEGKKVSAEDPYVWYHRKDKLFYAVLKDFTGKLTRSEPGLALMQSVDGIKWEQASTPLFMKKELILKDGEHVKVDRLERPQLLLNDSDDPIVLFAACSIDDCNPKKDGGTFNIHIPLKKIKIKK
jgi:hypothetical protein